MYNFFHLLREFVFFESLFTTDAAHNMPMFTFDSGDDSAPFGVDRQSSGVSRAANAYSGTGRTPSSVYVRDERRRQLHERLLRVPFDRALEEEKILNTVFPT